MTFHQLVELEENCERFFARSVSAGSVWAIQMDGGFLTCVAEDGEHAVIPFWSDAAYARRVLRDPELEGCTAESVPLAVFLRDLLGGYQADDLLIGPNYTEDMAGLELDPREVFEELRERIPAEQRAEYADALENATILTAGHPHEKLQRRIEIFARLAAEGGGAWTLTEDDRPLSVDIRARPGVSFVPLWSSAEHAERARRFAYAPDRRITVTGVQIDDFLGRAEAERWLIGAEPTVGLAVAEVEPQALLARVRHARERLDEEPSSDD